jgi:hypothetical protein
MLVKQLIKELFVRTGADRTGTGADSRENHVNSPGMSSSMIQVAGIAGIVTG